MFHKNGQYIFRNSLIHFFLQELIYFYFRSWYFFLFQELVYFWFQELIYVLFQELIHFYFRSFGTPLLQLVPSARNCQGQFRQQIHIQNRVGKFCLVGGGEKGGRRGVSNCPIFGFAARYTRLKLLKNIHSSIIINYSHRQPPVLFAWLTLLGVNLTMSTLSTHHPMFDRKFCSDCFLSILGVATSPCCISWLLPWLTDKSWDPITEVW